LFWLLAPRKKKLLLLLKHLLLPLLLLKHLLLLLLLTLLLPQLLLLLTLLLPQLLLLLTLLLPQLLLLPTLLLLPSNQRLRNKKPTNGRLFICWKGFNYLAPIFIQANPSSWQAINISVLSVLSAPASA
jgi:hypothetical protein